MIAINYVLVRDTLTAITLDEIDLDALETKTPQGNLLERVQSQTPVNPYGALRDAENKYFLSGYVGARFVTDTDYPIYKSPDGKLFIEVGGQSVLIS